MRVIVRLEVWMPEHTVLDIDPNDPANIAVFLAL